MTQSVGGMGRIHDSNVLVKLEQPKDEFNISHGIERIQELIVLVELEEPKTHLFW